MKMASLLSLVLRSADGVITKASKNTLSAYVPNAPHEYGQPLPTQGDAFDIISPERLREIVLKTPTASACINTIIDFAAQVELDVKNIDDTQPAPLADVAIVRQYLRRPNHQQTGKRFFHSLMRDVMTFGYAGVEIEPNTSGGVANLNVIDNQRIRVDYDEHGKVIGYNIINAAGQPTRGSDGTHTWQPEEVIWFVRDEQSDRLVGVSRVKMLFALGVLESLILTFISNRFTEGNVPYGMLDLGELSNDELQFAIDTWNEQIQKNGQHRIIFSNSRGGAKFFPFGYALKELEAKELLERVRAMIMGILGVTMNELGESQDINKSNGYNLSFVFKKRAIEPLLSEVCTTLTEFFVHDRLGLHDVEVFYHEIDSRDDLLVAQILDTLTKLGIISVNQARNMRGDPNTPGGEEPCVFTGRDWLPVSMINQFAQEQLRSLQLVNAQMIQGIQLAAAGATSPDSQGNSAQIKPPRTPLPMALPSMPNPPNSVGNPNAAIRFPKPNGTAPSGGNPQKTRGAAQANRNAGLRKEDM